MAGNKLSMKNAALIIAFAATIVLSLVTAKFGIFREISTIILFLPLLWAFMTLRPAGMIAAGTVLAAVRLTVELLQADVTNPPTFWESAVDSILPIALYVALGLLVYAYRRKQAALVSQVIAAGTVEARDRLASSLAHDFNNILTVILGTCQMLQRDKTLAAAAHKDVKIMEDAAAQGLDLVCQMRTTTREEETPVHADLADLVGRQMVLIEKVLPPNVHVVRHSSGALPVNVNRSQILRLLLNLCLNARDAMKSGGVLTIHTGRRQEGARDYAVVTVSDTGPGVDPAIIDRIFDPFFTTKQDAGGSGLGLSIVKSIAKGHDGKVEVANLPGSGASFSVLLPLDTAAVAAVACAAPTAAT